MAGTLEGSLAPCRDPLYGTVTLTPADGIGPAQLRQRLQEVDSDIYRLKGYLSTGSKTVYVDYSKAGLSISQSACDRAPVIVLIHAGSPEERTLRFIEWLGTGDR